MSSMVRLIDARIPVRLGAAEAVEPSTAWLVEAGAASPDKGGCTVTLDARASHPAACGCCGGRAPAAVALDRLFQARVRGTGPWFDQVAVASTSAEFRDAVRDAVRQDPVTRARFRLG